METNYDSDIIYFLGVDGKVLALNVVFDELLYAKMTFGES